MKTIIIGFHQDEYEQWVADLSCGHSRYFRHGSSVATKGMGYIASRSKTYIGFELDCKTCESPDVE